MSGFMMNSVTDEMQIEEAECSKPVFHSSRVYVLLQFRLHRYSAHCCKCSCKWKYNSWQWDLRFLQQYLWKLQSSGTQHHGLATCCTLVFFLLDLFSTLKMKVTHSSETSVYIWNTRSYIAEMATFRMSFSSWDARTFGFGVTVFYIRIGISFVNLFLVIWEKTFMNYIGYVTQNVCT
jgi:hypothetical protein